MIAQGLACIYAKEQQEDYLRLRKGFDALLRGTTEGRADIKVHQFVRAVEAVIKPERGRTERQFIHRGQVFAGRSEDARNILTEIYKLRSAAEHMNPLKDQLGAYPSEDHRKIIALRTFQAELLAGHVYQRILSEDHLRQLFVSEDSTTDFWGKPDQERISLWGDTIDLVKTAAERFWEDAPDLNEFG